jgi:hypothetical protein
VSGFPAAKSLQNGDKMVVAVLMCFLHKWKREESLLEKENEICGGEGGGGYGL